MISYPEYLTTKSGVVDTLAGIHSPLELHPAPFPFQGAAINRSLEIGRAALFLDTGLGKTICQCEWARHIAAHIETEHGRTARILFIAPLAVADQTISEARDHLGIDLHYSRSGNDLGNPYTITNYEMVHEFSDIEFDAVILDESSILKNFTGKTKRALCEQFETTRYKLAATATPAPNDLMEIGNHAEFLGVMRSTEMLSRWFIADQSSVGTYRLKGHAKKDFWRWVASWSVCATRPSDLGTAYADEDDRYQLPTKQEEIILVNDPDTSSVETGELFDTGTVNISNLNKIKRRTLDDRVEAIAECVNSSDRPFAIWCETNDESRALASAIPDAVEVTGSMSVEAKKSALDSFTRGEARVIISKSSICGFGMNWQHCRDVIFASVNFSFEKYYQAVRRFWRFGQTQEVHIRIYMSRQESNVWNTILRKARENDDMKTMMRAISHDQPDQGDRVTKAYQCEDIELPEWIAA